MNRRLLLYDADCDPCARFKRAVDLLDIHNKIDFMSIDRAGELGLLDGIPEARRHGSFHLIRPYREIKSGTEALPSVIESFPFGGVARRLVTGAPKGPSVLAFVYRTASRMHDTGSCKRRATSKGEFVLQNEVPELDVAASALSPALVG
jgi:predicted DCC family thiol-disulfide oxidoreductase YuxK